MWARDQRAYPLVYDTARTVRVLGEDESVNLQRINDPTDPEALDIANGRYDVVVDTGPSPRAALRRRKP